MARLEFLLCIIIKLVKERVSRAKFLRRGGVNVAENRLFCERKRIAHYLLFLLKITCDPAQVRRVGKECQKTCLTPRARPTRYAVWRLARPGHSAPEKQNC